MTKYGELARHRRQRMRPSITRVCVFAHASTTPAPVQQPLSLLGMVQPALAYLWSTWPHPGGGTARLVCGGHSCRQHALESCPRCVCWCRALLRCLAVLLGARATANRRCGGCSRVAARSLRVTSTRCHPHSPGRWTEEEDGSFVPSHDRESIGLAWLVKRSARCHHPPPP